MEKQNHTAYLSHRGNLILFAYGGNTIRRNTSPLIPTPSFRLSGKWRSHVQIWMEGSRTHYEKHAYLHKIRNEDLTHHLVSGMKKLRIICMYAQNS